MSASLNECTDMEFYHNLYVQIHQSTDVKLANVTFLLPSTPVSCAVVRKECRHPNEEPPKVNPK